MGELLNEYTDRLQKVYDERTAGDYTFLGLLAEFAKKVAELQVIEKIKEMDK